MNKSIMLFLVLSLFLIACDNVDLSQLSDEDLERVSGKLIVCEEPYMRHGSDCCLDQNENSICDGDEPKESVQEEKFNEMVEISNSTRFG